MAIRVPLRIPRKRFEMLKKTAHAWGQALLFLLAITLLLILAGVGEQARAESEPAAPAPAATTADPGTSLVEASEETVEGEAGSGSRNKAMIAALTIFVLAIFIGFEIITKVPPTLHTPLMSGSNAISGITLVGAVIVAGASGGVAPLLGMVAVSLATVNVIGGFLVTHRMLSMFVKRK